MMRASLRRPSPGVFQNHRRFAIQRFERAALIATDRAATDLKNELRTSFASARLGRLGMAFGSFSFLKAGRPVIRSGESGFFAGGRVIVRSRSERTQGAIQIYSQGGDILPSKGWLWMPTDNVPKRVGRYKMTPSRYMASSLATSIGPLIQIDGRHEGESLLVVRDVTARLAGSSKPRRLPSSGRVRVGRQAVKQIVMFVGIRRTSRAGRVDPFGKAKAIRSRLGDYFRDALGSI